MPANYGGRWVAYGGSNHNFRCSSIEGGRREDEKEALAGGRQKGKRSMAEGGFKKGASTSAKEIGKFLLRAQRGILSIVVQKFDPLEGGFYY